MRGNSLRLLMLATCLPLLLPLAGCFFVTDLINPGVLSAVGFDPATIIPPAGRTLVSFVNGTQFEADFVAIATSDPVVTAGTYTRGSAAVPSNETKVIPFDCPVAVIWPGDINEDFTLSPAAVTVVTDGGDVELQYTGSALESGRDFVCGDVIEVRLVQVGEGAAADDFEIRVRVLPGR
jgi:hypothetical protein